MDPSGHLGPAVSRRRFAQALGLSALAASPGLLAACGSGEDTSTSGSTDEENDLEIINSARSLELAIVAGYTKVVGLLGTDAAPLANQILAQEQQHADGLGTVAGDLGGTAVQPKSAAAYDQGLGLGALKSRSDGLRFAKQLEDAAIYFYLAAVPKLTNGDLRATAASIATDEAEHISVLAGLESGNDPAKQVPTAFVTAAKPTLKLT